MGVDGIYFEVSSAPEDVCGKEGLLGTLLMLLAFCGGPSVNNVACPRFPLSSIDISRRISTCTSIPVLDYTLSCVYNR